MQCFVCSTAPGPGGTQYGVRDAVGICQACGIGLCAIHGRRGAAPDRAFRCAEHRAEASAPAGAVRPSRGASPTSA